MTSSMASAQYINIKMADGTYRSHKTTPNMRVWFGEKAGTEVIESTKIVTLNGYTVTVKLSERLSKTKYVNADLKVTLVVLCIVTM